MGLFGFGPERRVKRRADFVRVQSRGERTTTPHFVLLVSAGPEPDGPARLGVVATKKNGNAVVRNRIKRLCRECFRLAPGFVPPGVDLVVIARNGAHELGLVQVQAEWQKARPSLLKRCAAVLAAARAAGAAAPTAPARPPRPENERK